MYSLGGIPSGSSGYSGRSTNNNYNIDDASGAPPPSMHNSAQQPYPPYGYSSQGPPMGSGTSDTALLQQLDRQRYLASIMGMGGNGVGAAVGVASHSGSTSNSMVSGPLAAQGYGSSPYGWQGAYGMRHHQHQQHPQPAPSPHMTQYLQQLQAVNRSQLQQPYNASDYNPYGSAPFDFSHQQHQFPQNYGGSGSAGAPDPYGSGVQGLHPAAYGGYPGYPMTAPPPSAVPPALTLSQTLARGAPTATLAPDGFPIALPVLMARPEDSKKLSSHQVLLRHQIEAFQATDEDVSTHTRGRNKPIMIGQIGIRCRHCAHLPVSHRQKGSTYFPASLLGLYQAAQNMSTTHMQCGLCNEMPDMIKHQFAQLLSTKVASSGAGRPFWADSAKKLGLVDTEDGIRFFRDVPPVASSANAARAVTSTTTTPRGEGNTTKKAPPSARRG